MRTEDFSKPIVAIANSFTQFVPGHAHLHPVGQQVKRVIDVELAQVILMWTLLSTNEKAQILAVAREQTAAALVPARGPLSPEGPICAGSCHDHEDARND